MKGYRVPLENAKCYVPVNPEYKFLSVFFDTWKQVVNLVCLNNIVKSELKLAQRLFKTNTFTL